VISLSLRCLASIDALSRRGQIGAETDGRRGAPRTLGAGTPLVLSATGFVSDSMNPRQRLCGAIFGALLLGGGATALAAQSVARVRSEENLRREPNGEVLARLLPGAIFDVVDRRDRWLQIDVEGWVWARSLQVSDDTDLALVVSEPQGENLRDEPSGSVVAHLARGMLLNELERRPGWIRVGRRAWVWSASVTETSSAASASEPPVERSAAREAVAGGFTTAGEDGATLLVAPDGDTLAHTVASAELAVVARQGNWARVRLEGWTWLPSTESPGRQADAASAALSPAELTADPTGYRGRMVSWQLQFISVERAEKVRTDFYEGEPFLLTRFGGPEGPFVYVAVPPDRISDVGGLVPLERITITGRVRAGASSLTGTPIIDLLTLERSRAPG